MGGREYLEVGSQEKDSLKVIGPGHICLHFNIFCVLVRHPDPYLPESPKVTSSTNSLTSVNIFHKPDLYLFLPKGTVFSIRVAIAMVIAHSIWFLHDWTIWLHYKECIQHFMSKSLGDHRIVDNGSNVRPNSMKPRYFVNVLTT